MVIANIDGRARLAISVLAAFGLSLLAAGCTDRRAYDEKRRPGKAETLFKLRCTSAGEKIKRTVTNVEGVYLLKLRREESRYGDQFRMNDPYGSDLDGDGYIKSFLSAKYEERRLFAASLRESKPPAADAPVGYNFVELSDPADQRRYRYTAYLEQPWKTDPKYPKNYWKVLLKKSQAMEAEARYGVTYEDISTREDRSLWIAGSSLKVIDLATNEVIAERIGYMFDPGQGSSGTGGGRAPWLVAASYACPSFPGRHGSAGQIGQTDRFVEKVLVPARRPDKDG